MKDLMVKAWGYVPDKKLVLTVTLVVCVVLVTIGGVLAGVKIPFKEKTALEIVLEGHWESWRLHANATGTFKAKDEKDRISDECIEIRRHISALQLARWQLMGVRGMDAQDRAVEVDMANTAIKDEKKRLLVAESSLSESTQLYKRLIAQR